MHSKTLPLALSILIALGLNAPLHAEEKALNPAQLSETVNEKPRLQDDFYNHINYDYLKNTKLPIDKAAVNNMSDLNDQAKDTIKAIFKELNAGYDKLDKGSDAKKVIDFYNMALDFKTRDELGFKPIAPYLQAVREAKDLAAFNQVQREYLINSYTPLIALGVAQDQKDSTTNILYLSVPELGIEKSQLEGEDDFSKRVRDGYQTYMQDILMLAGNSEEEAKRKAELVMTFEKALAAAQMSKEEELDRAKQYNEMTLAEIEALIPNVPYLDVIRDLGLDKAKKIVVQQPNALKTLNELATADNLDAMKAQMEVKIIKTHSSLLNKPLIAAGAKYLAVYLGMEHIDSDEELAYNITNAALGELLGKVYVEKTFSPQTKTDVAAMTDTIRDTYARRLGEVDWLSEDTKKRAQKKLDTLVIKIGYPDTWKDYPGLENKTYAEGGNLVEAALAINAIDTKRALAKLNQAPDRSEWHMTPHTVNAY